MTFSTQLSPQSTRLPVQPGAGLSSAPNWSLTFYTNRQGKQHRHSACIRTIMGMLTLLLLMAGHSSLARTGAVTTTAPGSITQPAGTQLSINKLVDKTTARIGDVLSYTLVISNVGSTTATNVVARDSSTTGLRYVSGSASVPAGSTFSSGAPISTWTVPSIGAGQSFSLTFQAIADSSGILYTKATIPGDTATVCTSVPVKVCTGDTYLFRLTAAPGRSSYKWFKNGVELTTQTTNVLDVTATGTYSLAIDNVSGRCPDFSCCPFVVEEDTLPTFRATILPVTCTNGTAQANGRITLTNYNPAYTYQYSAGADFNPAISLSGSAKVIPAGGVIVNNLGNPGSAQPYTIRVFNASGCYTDVTVTMQPTGCCALSAVATAGICQSATNTYSATAVITLTNSTTGILTVSNGPQSTTFATTAAPTASFTAVFANLIADGVSHPVTVSLPGCSSLTTTYTAPASCSVTPVPTLSLSVTPGTCQSATNGYSLTGTLSLTNASAGTATLTDGATSTTLLVNAGDISLPYSLTGLISGTGSHTLTVAYAGQTSSQTYTAPLSCSIAPVCSLSATATAGVCQSATNTFSASIVVNLTNTEAGTLTVTLPGSPPFSQPLTATTRSVTALFTGLISDAGSHTATISLPGCATTTATFTAPVSCSVAAAPICSMSAVVTAGTCQSATNTHSATAIVTVLNPVENGIVSVRLGQQTLTFSTSALSQNTFTATFESLISDGQTHSIVASLPGCSTTTAAYTAPTSCSVAPVPSLSLSVTPGTCQSATNGYALSGALSLTNASADTATLTDGTTSTTFLVNAGATSVVYSLTGLVSGTGSHTLTVAYASQTLSQTYTAPASCSVAPPVTPVCSVSAVATAGICQSATNTYSATTVVTLTNPITGILTVTHGPQSTTFATTANSLSFTAVFANLVSDSLSHTITVSLPGCTTTTATYTAPASCSVSPPAAIPGLTLSVTPGTCQSATNGYALSGTLSLTNAIAGTAIVTDGATSTSVSIGAGVGSVPYSLSGLTSGTNTHTVTVSYATQTVSATYTAPLSCSTVPVCSLSATATAGSCTIETNTFSASVIVNLTNVGAGILTVSNGPQSTTFATTAAPTASFTAVFANLIADGLGHTVTVSLPGCSSLTTTYTAPTSCSIVAAPSLALSAIPSDCQPATNGYSLMGTLSLTNASAGTATLTDGTTSTTLLVNAGATNVPYSLSGLSSGTGSHTLTVSYASQTSSQTYTAPLSCSVVPVCSLSATVTAGVCQSATNTYSSTVVVNIANPTTATLTVTNAGQTQLLAVTAATTSLTAVFADMVSDGGSHTVTVSLPGCTSMITTYTAPTSCSIATRIGLSIADPGRCDPATNTYTTTGVVSLTNATAGTATLTDGSSTTLIAVNAGAISVPYSLSGLSSGTGSHTVTVSYLGQTASTTYTSPASCSLTPVPTLSLSVTPGTCQSATNGYSLTGTLSLTNASAGTATLTDGATSTTLLVNAGDISLPYSLTGLISGTGSHTLTVAYAGQTLSQTYTAPLSCSVTPPAAVPSLSLSVTPGTCQTATNGYALSGALSLTNAIAGTATFTDGTATTTLTVNAGDTALPYSLSGLISGTGSHTVTVAYATQTLSQTYTAPLSCSVAPAPTLALSVIPGDCQTTTNTYSLTGTLSLTNAIAGTATITDGTSATTITVKAGASVVPYSLSGLVSGTGNHTIAVSYATQTLSQTYTAPLSCLVAPVCSMSAVVTAGTCQTATNTHSATAIVTVLNPVENGIVSVRLGQQTLTFSTSALSQNTFTATFESLISDGQTHSIVASLPGCSTTTAAYTAPTSCSVAPVPSLSLSVTPGTCQSATNGYALSGTLSLTNATAGTATFTDGTATTTLTVNAGATSVVYSLTGLVSGTGSHTLTVAYASQTLSQTYTAPASCSVTPPVTPVCSVSAVAKAIPATCQDNVTQANGQIVLSSFKPDYTYQYSIGASFDPAASLSGPAKPIPTGGIVVDTLANPASDQPYTVRVYSTGNCYTDVTTVLKPAVCACAADVCVPFVIQQTKRAKRIGDAR